MGEPLPYLLNIEELNFLGPGVILFFYYNKRILLMVMLASIIYAIYALATNILGNGFPYDCENSAAGTLPFFCEFKKLSSANKNAEPVWMIVQLCLGVLLCFVWVVGVRLIRTFGRRKNK